MWLFGGILGIRKRVLDDRLLDVVAVSVVLNGSILFLVMVCECVGLDAYLAQFIRKSSCSIVPEVKRSDRRKDTIPI